jgi:hypothetical protein
MRLTSDTFTGAARAAFFGIAVLAATSCGEVARTGQSPAFLIIDALDGASGADPNTFTTTVFSDVETVVEDVPTRFNDVGRVSLRLALRNPGSPGSPTAPSTLNEITITRYRVNFRRSDGRNTPGVDVPHGFDGAFTVTVPAGGTVQSGFNLVRNQAKSEPPLKNLVGGGAQRFISTIAEITFYGRDQAGNEVSVTGTISVDFADFADPA